ncbi:MAG: putative peptide maturation dehydrogenase [bacterium]|nr:putative peptide maturation dehydrogenase [bacterium]
MTQVKRSRYFVVSYGDEQVVDLGAFLRGRVEMAQGTHISAVSSLTEAAHRVTAGDLDLLGRVSSHEWVARSRLAADNGVPEAAVDALAAAGLLISDADDPVLRRLRQREESLRSSQWHPCASFYHLMAKNPDGLNKDGGKLFDLASVAAGSQDATDAFVARYGLPPAPFHEARGDGETVRLPMIDQQGGLYRALASRRTVRSFDRGTPMRSEDLATLLYWVFGCHGHTTLSKGVPLLGKTSPSGGSLHPVEVYPLVRNVADIERGLYHYRLRDHSLARIRPLEEWEAEALAIGMAAGQDFAAAAHVLLLMTARFYRNFWKYRRNVRTHSVILQDVAHLSQTLYLVCADLGLGAFYAAHDGFFVDEALALDGVEESAVGLAGCGVRPSGGMDYALDFVPYTPGETEV